MRALVLVLAAVAVLAAAAITASALSHAWLVPQPDNVTFAKATGGYGLLSVRLCGNRGCAEMSNRRVATELKRNRGFWIAGYATAIAGGISVVALLLAAGTVLRRRLRLVLAHTAMVLLG